MNSKHETFYSNGKLLITGEYVVLDGALSLAIPTKFGQSLKVELLSEPKLVWKSLDEKEHTWFEDEFIIDDILSNRSTSKNDVSHRLLQIFHEARQLNPKFLTESKGYKITTNLEFPKNWGLGTSSTLINNVANWASIDAYQLLATTFGGSGYDIACAKNDVPITYQIQHNTPKLTTVAFNPSFKEQIYFVYLNKKQNSREGIAHYKNNRSDLAKEISSINAITLKMIDCDNLRNFQKLMEEHEQIISNIIKQKPIKELLFSDFKGSVKSLGAWGGDFVMVVYKENPSNYFKSRGYETILAYDDLIK
ncbi:MAG: GYDIA family GHMP kinase [Aquaticitalea sp.]